MLHQIGTNTEIVARTGGFFFGFAEQSPDVLGGRSSLGTVGCAFLVFRMRLNPSIHSSQEKITTQFP